jgi:hypothetical protein
VDQQTINQLASLILQKLPSYQWQLVVVQVALTLVAAAVGAFLGE